MATNNARVWLARSREPIIPGRFYRWASDNDQWCRDRGYQEFNVVAKVTRINEAGMVFAFWNVGGPEDEQFGMETCIPNSAVTERVVYDMDPQSAGAVCAKRINEANGGNLLVVKDEPRE